MVETVLSINSISIRVKIIYLLKKVNKVDVYRRYDFYNVRIFLVILSVGRNY